MQLCGYAMYVRDLARKPCCLWYSQAPAQETAKKNTLLAAHCLRRKHGTIHWILKNLTRIQTWSGPLMIQTCVKVRTTSYNFQHLCSPLVTTKRFIVVYVFRCFPSQSAIPAARDATVNSRTGDKCRSNSRTFSSAFVGSMGWELDWDFKPVDGCKHGINMHKPS